MHQPGEVFALLFHSELVPRVGISRHGFNHFGEKLAQGTVPLARLASFADKKRYAGDLTAQLGGGKDGGRGGGARTTTFSKGFVFQKEERSSAGAERSSAGAEDANAAPQELVKPKAVLRTPLGGPASQAGGGKRGMSILATVLNGSKNWKKKATAQ